MKKVFKIVCFLFIMVILGLTGCKKYNYEGNIVEFMYEYGSFHGGYYQYKITADDENVQMVAKGFNGIDLNIDKTVNKSIIEELEKVIENNHVGRWNGFDKEKDHSFDGSSFTLEMKYSNGEVIKSHGYEKLDKNEILLTYGLNSSFKV